MKEVIGVLFIILLSIFILFSLVIIFSVTLGSPSKVLSPTGGSRSVFVQDASDPIAGPIEKYRFLGETFGLGYQLPSPSYNTQVLESMQPVETGDDIQCYYQDEIVAQLINKVCIGSYGNCTAEDGQTYDIGEKVQEYAPVSSGEDNGEKIPRCPGILALVQPYLRCITYNPNSSEEFVSTICDPGEPASVFSVEAISLGSAIKNTVDVAARADDKRTSGSLLKIFDRSTQRVVTASQQNSFSRTVLNNLGCSTSISGIAYNLTEEDISDTPNEGFVWIQTPPLPYCQSGAASGGGCVSGNPIIFPQMIVYIGNVPLPEIPDGTQGQLLPSQRFLDYLADNGAQVLVSTTQNTPAVLSLSNILAGATSCNANTLFSRYYIPDIS